MGPDLGGDSIFTLTATFSPELCASLLELMYHMHYLLSSLSWSRGVGEVVVMILEGDMDHLEEVVVSIAVNIILLIRDPFNVSIAGEITTSLRSAERSLVTLNGHSWLMLTLLHLVILLIFLLLHPLNLIFSRSLTIVLLQEENDRLC